MRDNSRNLTVERNYIQKWRFLIREYPLVKAKKNPHSHFAQDFYSFHGATRQTFAKYYNRFLLSSIDNNLTIESAAVLIMLCPDRRRAQKFMGRRRGCFA